MSGKALISSSTRTWRGSAIEVGEVKMLVGRISHLDDVTKGVRATNISTVGGNGFLPIEGALLE